MDPALRELLQGVETEELEVILKLRHPQAMPPHVRLVARFGQVVTGRVERRWIREVWGHPEVISFKAPRLLQAEPAIIDLEAAGDVAWRDSDRRRPAGLEVTGRGVVIGLVDVGCDFAHPHFRHADGSSRILALWDQSKAASPLTTAPYGYGAIYTRDDINRALAHSQPYKTLGYHPAQADPSGIGAHGTLVLDIAAGNGQTPGSPQGVAPDADLIFVHAATGVMGGLANLGDSVRILEALDFIARTAKGRPWVINVSMGRRGGSHDGLSLVEQGMDALLMQTSGSALVLSTGNYFSSQAHASGQLRPAQERTLIWRTDKADITPNELEIWYSGKDAMTLEVRVPEKGPLFRAPLAEDCPVLIGGRDVGHIYHRARDPNNGDNQINIFLGPGAPAGDWQITLMGDDIVDGIFHAWVERDAPCPRCDSRFEPQDVDPYCTTGTLCNGFRTIAAGAYDGHSSDREIAYFSSCGPLRDFRQKPDLLAPGVKVLGARSAPGGEKQPSFWLTRMSGTSFAAPQVTGTIALMFDAVGRPLAIQETRQLLLGSIRSAASGNHETVRLGSGYLDIERAVAAAQRFGAEGLTPILETRLPPPEQGTARLSTWPRSGIITMESTMTGEDEEHQTEGPAEWSPPEEEPTEKATKRVFLLISGGPGPYDDRDVEHDQSWANYVSPPLLLTDSSEKQKKFSEKDEEIWWLIYRPAYACRWKDDFGNTSTKRQKAIQEVTDQGFTSYLDLLQNRARTRGWNLRWLDDADGFWKKLKTFPKRSISRLWYWGHARDDLWLSLGHSSDAKGTAIAPEPHEIIQVTDIEASLQDRFQAGDADRISRFVGCNTAAFAKAWAKAFKVWTEGVEEKIGFKSIHSTGGEPCLVGSAAARVFKPGGVEDAAATTGYQTCKDLGLGEALEFAEMEAEEEFPDTGFEFMEAEIEELGEPDDTGIEVEEPEESGEEFIEKEEDPGQRLVEAADRIIASGGSPAKPAAFLSRVLFEAGVEAFGGPLRLGAVRFPAPEVIWKAWKKPASTQWHYIERFLEVIAEPGSLLRESLQTGDIMVRVAPGEPALGHLALIADPQLWGREELAAVGLTPEGHRPGRYVQVVEGGARPHGLREGFARRMVDEAERVPANPPQLILRFLPELMAREEMAPQVFQSLQPEEVEAAGSPCPANLCQEALKAVAQEKDPAIREIRQKLVQLCQAMEKQDKTAIPQLLQEFAKEKSVNTLSVDLALELAICLYLMGLENESKLFRQHAFTLLANANIFLKTQIDKDGQTREYEVNFWAELVKRSFKDMKLTDAQVASRFIDRLLKLFNDIRNVVLAYDPKDIQLEREYEYDGPGEGKKKYRWRTYEDLFEQLRLLLTGMQRAFQALLDAAVADLEAGKGFSALELAQKILETQIQKAIYPLPNEERLWEVEITKSEFRKHGGLHLDFFLEGKAARERSVAITFYDETGDTGNEKTMGLGHIYYIRLRQIKFLKRLYGVPGNVAENGGISAEGQENKRLISRMTGRRFRLHNDDDWREFLQLKFQALRFKTRELSGGALLQIQDLLHAYLGAFTLHTDYNICDFCDAFCGSGPEKENYLNKKFPRALSGQLLHDCGVYALRAAYILSLVRRDADLLFRFIYLPAHVGLIILQVGRVSAGKKHYMPFSILHNDFIFRVGNLIEQAKIRKDWEAFKVPGATGPTAKPLPIDDLQFLGELAAPAYIPGPVDMPFRLKDVPDDPKLTAKALKAKLWAFYKKEACIELFGEEAKDPKSAVFQIHLHYLKLITDFKNLWNNQLRDFWNGQAPQAWRDVKKHLNHEAPQGKIPARKAFDLLKGYRGQLSKDYAPIVKRLNELEEEKKELSAVVEAHPKLKKTGIRFTFGLRAAIVRPPGLLEVFEEFQKHLKKLDDSLTMLEKQHQEILLTPILQALEPLFATKQGFLEPID